VQVHALQLLPEGDETLRIDVTCGAGTYVRSLARDIGEALGCGAHLAALRRLQVGPYQVDRANTVAELERLIAAGLQSRALLAADDGLASLPALLLGDETANRLANGLSASTETEEAADPVRIFDTSGRFVGVGSLDAGGRIRCRKVLIRA
jgi:tRNA pseudouridine55 synthase